MPLKTSLLLGGQHHNHLPALHARELFNRPVFFQVRLYPLEQIAPVMARSVVAAEDANFCQHWGFDMAAIRDAIDGGATRGASTISQQVVKNLFLWPGRSWIRKGLEAYLTLFVELLWPKQR